MDDGESIAQAAVREAREETGLEVALTRLVGTYSLPRWLDGGAHEVLFAARPAGGRLQKETRETLDARLFGLEELPEPLQWWHHRRILDAFGDATGVVWSQDVVWPLSERTRQEVYERLQGAGKDALLEAMLGHLCGRCRPLEERLEVGPTCPSP